MITHFYWISEWLAFGNPVFRKKITRKLGNSGGRLTHLICISRSLKIRGLRNSFLNPFMTYLNIEHEGQIMVDFQRPLPGLARNFNELRKQEKDSSLFSAINMDALFPGG
jgi:hypothetical protein